MANQLMNIRPGPLKAAAAAAGVAALGIVGYNSLYTGYFTLLKNTRPSTVSSQNPWWLTPFAFLYVSSLLVN